MNRPWVIGRKLGWSRAQAPLGLKTAGYNRHDSQVGVTLPLRPLWVDQIERNSSVVSN